MDLVRYYSALMLPRLMDFFCDRANLGTFGTYVHGCKPTQQSTRDPNIDPLATSDTARRSWITTLDKLRALDSSTAGTADVIDGWITFGRYHGFKERAERAWFVEHPQPDSATDGRPWEHCGWSDCLCHEQKALHNLRACKRCWKVYYCGEKCQQM